MSCWPQVFQDFLNDTGGATSRSSIDAMIRTGPPHFRFSRGIQTVDSPMMTRWVRIVGTLVFHLQATAPQVPDPTLASDTRCYFCQSIRGYNWSPI